jgi:uncharacterized protein (TIGR03067 family)
MRLSSLLLLLSTVGVLFAGGREDAIKKELKQFQGEWQAVVVINADGKPLPEEQVKAMRLFVEGTKFTLKTGDATITGTFSIDPTTNPKIIDFQLETINKDKSWDIKMEGIFETDGNIRKSCFYVGGKNRPTQFVKGKDHLYFEWKRIEKPGPSPKS